MEIKRPVPDGRCGSVKQTEVKRRPALSNSRRSAAGKTPVLRSRANTTGDTIESPAIARTQSVKGRPISKAIPRDASTPPSCSRGVPTPPKTVDIPRNPAAKRVTATDPFRTPESGNVRAVVCPNTHTIERRTVNRDRKDRPPGALNSTLPVISPKFDHDGYDDSDVEESASESGESDVSFGAKTDNGGEGEGGNQQLEETNNDMDQDQDTQSFETAHETVGNISTEDMDVDDISDGSGLDQPDDEHGTVTKADTGHSNVRSERRVLGVSYTVLDTDKVDQDQENMNVNGNENVEDLGASAVDSFLVLESALAANDSPEAATDQDKTLPEPENSEPADPGKQRPPRPPSLLASKSSANGPPRLNREGTFTKGLQRDSTFLVTQKGDIGLPVLSPKPPRGKRLPSASPNLSG